MKISSRLLLPALLLGAPATFAQAPAPTPTTQAAPSARSITVDFRGSLRDAIKKIAEEGGLSVIVTGELDSPAEVHLQGVTAEQALRTLARSYSLRMELDGSIITLRPLTAEEKRFASVGPNGPVGPTGPVGPNAGMPPPRPMLMPPMPPMPPTPSLPEDFDTDEVRERMRERMKQVRRPHRGGRDVVARGHNLEVKENESVDSAVVYGGNLIIKGHVEDDAVAFGGNLEVSGVVEGDAHAFGGNVILNPGAVVQGDVSSFGGTVSRSDEAHVEGSTESFGGANIGRLVAGELKNNLKKAEKREVRENDEEREDRDDSGFPGFILMFATLFGVGFLGQLFFPARMRDLGTEIRTRPGLCGAVGGIGFFAVLALTLVFGILSFLLVGIPLLLALWLAVPLSIALGLSAVASEIGTKLPVLRGRKTQAVVLALGLVVMLAIGSIPILGTLFMVLLSMVALGAIIRTRFGIRPKGMPEPILHSEPV
jgi:cytoskeletal protein CcmA (bactofilin family)